jgi:hypothetical protein
MMDCPQWLSLARPVHSTEKKTEETKMELARASAILTLLLATGCNTATLGGAETVCDQATAHISTCGVTDLVDPGDCTAEREQLAAELLELGCEEIVQQRSSFSFSSCSGFWSFFNPKCWVTEGHYPCGDSWRSVTRPYCERHGPDGCRWDYAKEHGNGPSCGTGWSDTTGLGMYYAQQTYLRCPPSYRCIIP